MNPILAGQLVEFLEFLIAQGLNIRENNTYTNQFKPSLIDALANNRPLTTDEMLPIHAGAQQAHDELRDA